MTQTLPRSQETLFMSLSLPLRRSFLALPLLVASTTQAAISYATPETPHLETFVAVAGDGDNPTLYNWTNNSTIPGWFLYMSGGPNPATDAIPGPPDVVHRGIGNVSVPGAASASFPDTGNFLLPFYYYRPGGSSTDAALGMMNGDASSRGVGTGYLAIGVTFINNTGQTLNSFSFDYDVGIISTAAVTNPDAVTISYAIDATGVSDQDGTWTTVEGMGYSIPANASPVVAGPTLTTAGLLWEPGKTLTIRFRDVNVGATDRYSYIDNVTFSASPTPIPEPTTAALLLPGAILLTRRRA